MFYKIRFTLAVLILIAAILGITGIFYPVKFFDIQLAPLLQRVIVDFSIIALGLIIVLTLLTLLFGRLYCSLLCPLGIIQELIGLFRGENREETRKNLPFKYFIAAIVFGTLTGGSAIIIRYIEPYTYFGSAFTLSLTGIITVIAIIILTVFKNRYFCSNICPVGCLLGLLSKFSLFKIYIDKNECLSCSMCESNCPTGCINIDEQNVDNEICVKCFKCLEKCPKQAIRYGIKPKEEVKFNIQRRKVITLAAALTVFIGAIKLGVDLSKTAAKKIRNIILPPGAVSENRLFNKCLNCNLCVKACPNKIIKKADEIFSAVHIEYNDKNYCKYDCIECSKVCPSGAIKKLTLEEKQNLRIAMAVINSEKCDKCAKCVSVCPKGAISQTKDNITVIDSSKCIGCGKCKTVCDTNAIEIFAVNEQKVL